MSPIATPVALGVVLGAVIGSRVLARIHNRLLRMVFVAVLFLILAPVHQKRFELLISRMLLGGVAISMTTVFLGLLLVFVHHPDCLKSAADLQRLTAPGSASPNTITDVAAIRTLQA